MKTIKWVIPSFLLLTFACTPEKKHSTVKAYLNHLSTEDKKLSIQVVKNDPLPSFSPQTGMYVQMSKTAPGSLDFYNGDDFSVKKFDLLTGRELNYISFSLQETTKQKSGYCFKSDDQTYIWHTGENKLYLFNQTGALIKTETLTLSLNGESYFLSASANSSAQFDALSNTVILPVYPTEGADGKTLYEVPRFVSYNLTNGKTQFIPIKLPKEYSTGKTYGMLDVPYTAMDNGSFYAIFPLVATVFEYNIASGQLNSVPLSLPVSLAYPSAVKEGRDFMDQSENEYRTNRITGFAVNQGKIYIQQTEGWDETLESKLFTENTVLHAFSRNGTYLGGGQFPEDVFGSLGVFYLKYTQNNELYFTSFDSKNSKRLIAIKTK
ncbi:MAG: DUF4221 domain-containing protein [Flavobacteriales bacterium]|nr:DUF4221 domain-containing protein [Flavobacteriales bacterium]